MNTNNETKARETAIAAAMSAVTTAIKSSKDHLKALKTAASKAVLVLIEFGATEPLNKLFKEVSTHDAEGVRIFIRNMHKDYGWKTDRGLEQGPVAFTRERGWFVRNNDPNLPQIADSKARIVKAGETALMKLETGDRAGTANRAEREFDFDKALAGLITRAAKEGTSVSHLKKINALIDDESVRLKPADIEKAAQATEAALKRAKDQVAKYEKRVAARAEKDKETVAPEKVAANA